MHIIHTTLRTKILWSLETILILFF